MFKDERGIIKDLIVGKNWALTYITFNPGAVRGNHFHRHTLQIDFVWGKLICKTNSRHFVKRFGFIKHPSPIPHAYKALKKSIMLTFVIGERVGDNYSRDTFKLDNTLL